MPFYIVQKDITTMDTDAVVNAADTELRMGSGVCGAIFKAAGPEKMKAACRKAGPIHTGEAAITPGFGLKARFVIHTAGPVYDRSKREECERLLSLAYSNSLELARENGCVSIAFPLISSGVFGYPKEDALRTAVRSIRSFLDDNEEMTVYLTVLDRKAVAVSKALKLSVGEYLTENYMPTDGDLSSVEMAPSIPGEVPAGAFESGRAESKENLDSYIRHMDVPFNSYLMRMIDARGMKDSEVYKRADIDRRLFSKIRTRDDYVPGKRTVLALAIGLKLDIDATEEFLERAGYALSHSQKFDVIVEYFIKNGHYDIDEINEVLFAYDQPLLGAK